MAASQEQSEARSAAGRTFEWVRVPGVPAVIDCLPVIAESLGLLLWRHDVSLFSAELGLPTDNLGCDFIDLEVNFSNVSTPGGPSGLIEACFHKGLPLKLAG